MDTELGCYLCKTPGASMHCDICNNPLCKTCVGEHLSDETKEHKVVSIGKRGSTSICQQHLSKLCEFYCEKCEIPICVVCVTSRDHQTHKLEYILESLERKKGVLQKDLQKLENSIFPKYQEISSNIPRLRDGLKRNSDSLKQDIKKYGDDLHREVDKIIQDLEYDLNEINSKQLAYLEKQEIEIAQTISKITECIDYLKKLLESYDVGRIFSYKTKNYFPPKVTDIFPRFTPPEINKGDIYKHLGSPSVLPIRAEDQNDCNSFENIARAEDQNDCDSFENIASSFQTKAETKEVYTMDSPVTWSSSPNRPFIGTPQIISKKNTKHDSKSLKSVSYLSDGKVWTSGLDNKLRLYDFTSNFELEVLTKPMKCPWDIAVKKDGNLFYTDYTNKTVNKVIITHEKENTQNIEILITLKGWEPLNVCSTSSDDLLVVMFNKTGEETKVVRYSGCFRKQTIQYSDEKKPLYSSCQQNKYISENKNLDICVSDYGACAVVVVDKAGTFRFRYTGVSSIAKESLNFRPYGITTDSQSRILTADPDNSCIHILDQDGNFLRYIDNCQLQYPWGLCVDTSDNLIVAEHKTGTVKKIQYLARACIQNMF